VCAAQTRVDASLLKRVSQTLQHRGPDDQGFLGWSGSGPAQVARTPLAIAPSWVSLLHRRLSILDLSAAGWQPMGTPDGQYYIVFNGEIYNYLELRDELQALGYTFRSQSDTEVLLTAYRHWGWQALTRLIGMFAFAILDTRARRLFLVRDCFGIKPLYYTYWRDGFAFASEIKALLELPGMRRQVHPERLYAYLRFGLTDHGTETFFADILQLPAAHYLELSLDHVHDGRPVRYWQIDLQQQSELSGQEAAGQLRDLFLENIRLHLRSDVPVGAALSGGIDSSAIVMAMRQLQGQALQLHTFSYIADQTTLSEEAWVERVGQAARATVHKVRPEPQEIVTDIASLVDLQAEPFGSTSIYAQMRVFRLAQEAGIKVMLDGQGADELLGGYRVALAARLASLLRQGQWGAAYQFLRRASALPEVQRQMLLARALGVLALAGLPVVPKWSRKRYLFPPWLNAAWFVAQGVMARPIWHAQQRHVLREHLWQALTENSLPMLLRYEDRNSMAFSIESRTPFLTPALVNFVFSLPEAYLIAADGTSKAVFRRAMHGIVPETILERRDKIGFATPERSWLIRLQPWANNVLHSDTARSIAALHLDVVQQQWQGVLTGQHAFDFRCWRWLNVIYWAQQFQVSFAV
jgi:asparagine synthase (glutamine-hydrolysing)